MRKSTLTMALVFVMIISVFAQSPQAFKHQAVVRDNTGEIISNQSVSFRINIHDGSAVGTVIYQETHNLITNQFGLAIMEIGNGTPVVGTFANIDWGSDSKFMELELDMAGGTNYLSMGTTQMMSVPYALHSKTSDDSFWEKTDNFIHTLNNSVGIGTTSPATKLDVNGTITANAYIGDGSALTGISTDNNWLISGNNIYNGNTGNVGIGTTNPNAKLDVRSLTSTPGIYTTCNGGWSLWASAFGTGSVGVMVESDIGIAVEAVVSGIGIAKLCSSEDNAAGYFEGNLFVENGNVGIGLGTTNPNAKLHIRNQTSTPGIFTESVGGWALWAQAYDAGSQGVKATSYEGTAVYAETSGGYLAKLCSTEDNAAGYFNGNLFVEGGDVGIGTTSPDAKLQVNGSMRLGTGVREFEVLEVDPSYMEGWSSLIDYGGIGIGSDIGNNRQMIMFTDGAGSDNIFTVATSQNDGGSWETDFVIQQDGNVGIGTDSPSQRLTVYNGSTTGTYTTAGWLHSSDARLKTNIAQIDNSLDKIMNMNGVYFDWKNKDEKHQVGLIAQDVEKVLPEVVNKDEQGFYSVAYGGVVPVLIEAIKEQQELINSVQNQNEDLKKRLDKLEKMIQQ